MANHAAIHQQDGHFEAVLAGQRRVGIDIEDGGGRDPTRAFELGQLLQHLLTEVAADTAQHDQAGRQGHGRDAADYFGRGGEMPRPSVAEAFVDFTWVAMNFTVFGGTSPTTVTW